MIFLYEELEYYNDGGCGGSNIKKHDSTKPPVENAKWLEYIKIEMKGVSVSTRKWPRAVINPDTGEPEVVWEGEDSFSSSWDDWCLVGWSHGRTRTMSHEEKWTRRVKTNGWFVSFETLEEFVTFCKSEGGFEIYNAVSRSFEDGDKWKPLLVLRSGMLDSEV